MAMLPGETLEQYSARRTQEAHEAFWRQNPTASTHLGNPMPLVNQMLTSKYITKTDLPGPLVCHIRGVSLDQGGRNGEDPKWLMYFHEHRKAMRLNNVVLRYLEATLGANSDAWIGKKVQLYVDPTVQMAGQVVGGVRLRVAKSQQPGNQPTAYGNPMPAQQPRFDPQTGQPLQQSQAGMQPAASAQMGQPQVNWSNPSPQAGYGQPQAPTGPVDSSTGEVGVDPDFDDDIPF